MKKYGFFVFLTSLLYLQTSIIHAENNLFISNKQEQWNQLYQEVGFWSDGIGYPIDTQILETVVALNANGFKTSASCEGHLDRGAAYPWIDFNLLTAQTDKLYSEINTFLEEIKPINDSDSFQDTEQEVTKFHEINELFRRANFLQKQMILPLYETLNQFYKNHVPSSYDVTLVLNFSIDGNARLQNLGAHWQEGKSDEEKAKKLKEYQAEMQQFTAFLKNQFLSAE